MQFAMYKQARRWRTVKLFMSADVEWINILQKKNACKSAVFDVVVVTRFST